MIKEGLSDKKAKEKAEKIQKEVEKNPSKFGEIAKKESMDSSSAKKDGSLGYVIKGQMVDSFEKALFKLKEGQVSKVVKTDYGYHIIKADKENDFNKEKSNLKEKIIEQKVQKKPKLLTDAYKDLLDDYKVDYKDRDIKKAVENSILDPDKIKQQQQQQQSSQGGASGSGSAGLTSSGS
ncbi:Foldase protein PrsA (fragment) [Staphylococcus capitis]